MRPTILRRFSITPRIVQGSPADNALFAPQYSLKGYDSRKEEASVWILALSSSGRQAATDGIAKKEGIMRSMVVDMIGGTICAACLFMGLPVTAEDLPQDMAVVDAECTEPGGIIWKRQFGTQDDDRATGVAVDAGGNILIAGYTWGSLGGPNQGNEDAFVAKYDANSKHLWTRQFGTGAADEGYGVATDVAGNVVIAGSTYGSLGGFNRGYSDVFIAKYDVNGKHLWARQFGTGTGEEAYSLATDAAGNVVVAGYTWGSLGGANQGNEDAFVAKYDANGKHLWTRQFGTAEGDRAYGVATDGSDNVVIAGWSNFNPFIAKYDAGGQLLWARVFDLGYYDYVAAVATDVAGNIVIAGGYDDNQAHVAKYDGSGNRLWRRYVGGPNYNHPGGPPRFHWFTGVAADTTGNVLIAGYRIRIGWKSGYILLVAKYDASGNHLWTRLLDPGIDAYAEANGVATDAAGNVVVAGWTDTSLGGPHKGEDDAFVAKLCP
ncbi:MAG: SBBP repeat-containing protein [Rhodospirillales bacterium]